MDTIQINKFSRFHNGSTVFFCKTDYLDSVFKEISLLKNKVILISGNSDYCINQKIVSLAPKNIHHWFCQNKLCDSTNITSIPLGIENTVECSVSGHGLVHPHAIEKPKLLTNLRPKNPSSLILSNFNVWTNPNHRSRIREISINADHINWVEPNLSYEYWIDTVLDHRAVLCAQGNDSGDNHRIYETLYLGRIPLTFNKAQYDHLHHKFPIVLIEDENRLKDSIWLDNKISEQEKNFNNELLDFNHWANIITKKINEL